jgi:hypothetical protein
MGGLLEAPKAAWGVFEVGELRKSAVVPIVEDFGSDPEFELTWRPLRNVGVILAPITVLLLEQRRKVLSLYSIN